MKIIHIILKVVLCLMLASTILGAFGVFPEPTADLYNTPEAFAFIQALYASGYIVTIMAAVFALAIIAIAAGRTALAMILILPITVNIVAFHAFLDGGLFTAGSIMAIVLAAINVYFLWQSRAAYRSLWA